MAKSIGSAGRNTNRLVNPPTTGIPQSQAINAMERVGISALRSERGLLIGEYESDNSNVEIQVDLDEGVWSATGETDFTGDTQEIDWDGGFTNIQELQDEMESLTESLEGE